MRSASEKLDNKVAYLSIRAALFPFRRFIPVFIDKSLPILPLLLQNVEPSMAEPEGDALMEGLATGRADAFAALYDRFGPGLFRVARTLLDCPQDAEDAVQEVFVGLVRARRTLREVKNLRAYVFAALRRAAARLTAGRKARRALPLHDLNEIAMPAATTLALEQAVGLERALRGLPPDQRELVALKVDGGLTFVEIGSVLGISMNTAASRYRYALEKLRAALTADKEQHKGR
jgi:RNA polymerase sigma-70 factor (ECF subfamily)